jgi:hypothetical protein
MKEIELKFENTFKKVLLKSVFTYRLKNQINEIVIKYSEAILELQKLKDNLITDKDVKLISKLGLFIDAGNFNEQLFGVFDFEINSEIVKLCIAQETLSQEYQEMLTKREFWEEQNQEEVRKCSEFFRKKLRINS